MRPALSHTLHDRARKFLKHRLRKIAEINERYAKPRVQMTPMVRLSLLMLRVYLLLLVGILFYKFITLLR